LTRKTRPRVFGGTLNLALSIYSDTSAGRPNNRKEKTRLEISVIGVNN